LRLCLRQLGSVARTAAASAPGRARRGPLPRGAAAGQPARLPGSPPGCQATRWAAAVPTTHADGGGCGVAQLLENPKIGDLFPPDVLERARRYLAAIPGGTGAYSDSCGAGILRQEVAKVRAQD
jgi:hypothetical protein